MHCLPSAGEENRPRPALNFLNIGFKEKILQASGVERVLDHRYTVRVSLNFIAANRNREDSGTVPSEF